MTRCAPHELDSVKEGHASPSPPVALAGSDRPSEDNTMTPTGNKSLIRIPHTVSAPSGDVYGFR